MTAVAVLGVPLVVWVFFTITGAVAMHGTGSHWEDAFRDAARGSALLVGWMILCLLAVLTCIGLVGLAVGDGVR